MTTEDTFTLTPPEAVAPVPREKAGGLVPVDPSVQDEMARRAAEYVGTLAALDARSPEFAGKVGEIAGLGASEMRGAAAQSNRMLERTLRSLPDKGGDAQSHVAGSLVELRRVVEDLDPRDLPASKGRKFLSKLPGGNKLRDHVAKYASSQATLNKIVGSLRGGQDELRRDNAALQTERVRLWETMGKLQEYVVLTQALDTAVEEHIATAEAVDPAQADTLRADVLFPVRQKHQDLLTQLAVCAQGYLAMDVVRRNNDELIKGVDRAATTTVSALRISVMLASALENQRKVVDQVNALRGTTEDLIRGNAEMLATQSGEIQRIAADPAVGAETLRTAFQQIYRTLDAIDTYKVQATESMAATVESLTSELQHASAYLERSRSRGALEGGSA
ncbi:MULTISPECIES: toxic anion resistance protein [Streptomyces]|uniref:Toxic anion resistance protein n=1 Tax=Streptomyces mirabilis TaxID=68239 RepID=A0ABU3ULU5_9ACTN|nr:MULTISPECIES: toxic anion resistance protein [Streptomyces]MCX4611446.1 toxic anion resistance protein [Streptomyces mirabilis]MCX5351660.1 toxic anion resistance protein [Streptomyces mirabilis]MDU8994859.1 toxic anion resistance protein [Streptomyces mirabilis]NMI60630.1 toxic anion resistance protein [Streptomyces sp. RLA2-12]QDN59771.1 toxic anion resistance protein [Streptomyces sp. S1D4-20]